MWSQTGLFKAIVRISHLPSNRAGHWENISVIPTLCKECKWHNQVMQWFESSSFWQRWRWPPLWHRHPESVSVWRTGLAKHMAVPVSGGQGYGPSLEYRVSIYVSHASCFSLWGLVLFLQVLIQMTPPKAVSHPIWNRHLFNKNSTIIWNFIWWLSVSPQLQCTQLRWGALLVVFSALAPGNTYGVWWVFVVLL